MESIKNIAFDFGGVVVALSLQGAIKAFEKIGVKDASQRLDAFHQTPTHRQGHLHARLL